MTSVWGGRGWKRLLHNSFLIKGWLVRQNVPDPKGLILLTTSRRSNLSAVIFFFFSQQEQHLSNESFRDDIRKEKYTPFLKYLVTLYVRNKRRNNAIWHWYTLWVRKTGKLLLCTIGQCIYIYTISIFCLFCQKGTRNSFFVFFCLKILEFPLLDK